MNRKTATDGQNDTEGAKCYQRTKYYRVDNMWTEGPNVTRGQDVTVRRTCHMVDNMSHIDELSHAEQTSSPYASDHHMLTPP